MRREKKTNWIAIAIGITLAITIINMSQIMLLKQGIALNSSSDSLRSKNQWEIDDQLQALTKAVIERHPDIEDVMIQAHKQSILAGWEQGE